jgi:uncharacterized protein
VRPLLVAGVAAVALAVAGCGSSESEPQSTASQTSEPAGGALQRLPQVPDATASTRPPSSADIGQAAYLKVTFEDVQAMWTRDFEAARVPYEPARITLFRDEVHTACGTQTISIGPFYCPADHGVYLDTRFFAILSRAVGVRLGDFAQAYVVAHEVAHHVQELLGILPRVRAADQQDPDGENARSVRLELQADCFAGVWAHSRYQRGSLSAEDVRDALNAAAVVGNDFQQYQASGTIRPEDWTHGSSRQRQHWLTTGLEQGKPSACDTFADAAAGG